MLSGASKDVRLALSLPVKTFLKHLTFSPISVLEARKKKTCSVCTLQEDRPVMIEEGPEWIAHQKTRSHRRLATKTKDSNTLRSERSAAPELEEELGVRRKRDVDDHSERRF